jgi:hypothetical protein
MRPSAELKASSSPTVISRKRDINHWIEIVSAVLISLATVVSAWCAYQSALWAGEALINFNLADAARSESVRMANRALQLTTIDVKLFTEYVTAYSNGNQDLADFLFNRFRPEMKLATEAWIETQPLINPDAPGTPFDMPEYQSVAQAESDRLHTEAVDHLDDAHIANRRSDEYILLTVIFTSVLFFAGISTKFESVNIQISMVAFASLIFVVMLILVGTFPIL